MTFPPETANETDALPAEIPPNTENGEPKAGRAFPAWKAGVILTALLAYAVLNTLLKPVPSERLARIERATSAVDALRDTKLACLQQQEAADETRKSGPKSRMAQTAQKQAARAEDDAIAQWHKLTVAKTAGADEQRRLGITLFQFGRKDALKTLQQLPEIRRKTESDARVLAKIPLPERITLTIAQESALWDKIYGALPLDRAEVPRLRSQLAGLHLGWFEHLAAAHLYDRAGMATTAAREHSRALSVVRPLWWLVMLQVLLVPIGAFGLIWLARARSSLGLQTREGEVRSRLANAVLPGDVRLAGFVVYLGVSFVIGLPFILLRPLFHNLSDVAAGRVNVALGVGLYVPVAWITFRALQNMARAALPNNRSLTLRDTLNALGFRASAGWGEAWAGVVGFALSRPFFVVAALISSALFSHFTTPPHPVTLWVIAMRSPLDQVALMVETAVAAPLIEEAMFRGLLYSALRARWGVARGVIVSSAVFALVHPTLPGGFLPLWALGASFAIAYENRGSLWPGIVMHSLNNALILLLQFAILAR